MAPLAIVSVVSLALATIFVLLILLGTIYVMSEWTGSFIVVYLWIFVSFFIAHLVINFASLYIQDLLIVSKSMG